MKKICLIVALLSSISCHAQVSYEAYNETYDQYLGTCIDLPLVRKTAGGTVFQVTYEGNWTEDMKGAFEYACKLWEDQLPTCFPINIHAKIAVINRGANRNDLSKVEAPAYIGPGNVYYNKCAIKYIVLEEYKKGGVLSFCNNELLAHNFNNADFTITINENKLNEFSFAIDSRIENKYDFVTEILRDIARGLGFYSNLIADNQAQIMYTPDFLTTFSNKIWNVLDASNMYHSYQMATMGELTLNSNFSLYAPNPWQNGVSLNSFIPNNNHKITQLLGNTYGKGVVIRDISDNYSVITYDLLDWAAAFATGSNMNSEQVIQKTNIDYCPINGYINISDTNVGNLSSYNDTLLNTTSEEEFFPGYGNGDIINEDSLFWEYHPCYHPDHSQVYEGWYVAIQLKNGKWDMVYYQSSPFSFFSVAVNLLEFHNPLDEYARTIDGYLKCRISRCHYYLNGFNEIVCGYSTYYYALDNLPQKVKCGLNKIIEPIDGQYEDEYLREIELGVKNLEGVERIRVIQQLEYDDTPNTFEVNDFKKGNFTAIVDKEYAATFTIISYNSNGHTTSEVVTIPPIEPIENIYAVSMSEDYLNIRTNRHRNIISNQTSFSIFSIGDNVTKVASGKLVNKSTKISIKDLKSDFVVVITNKNGEKSSYKFHR